MNILTKVLRKIHEVRRQPEHVRIRWVWGCVAVSMFIIIAIWILSLASLFQGDKSVSPAQNTSNPSITDQLKTLQQQAPSIKGFSSQPATNEGKTTTQNSENNQPSITDGSIDDIPQSDTYSDLSSEDSGQ